MSVFEDGPETGPPLPPAAQKVQDALAAAGLARRIRIMPETTRSSAEAATAIGCNVDRIAKSIVFRAKRRDRPVLAIASGANRIDEKAVKAVVGERIGRADADYVRSRTGFAIGGVPPLGHSEPAIVVIDRDLLALPEIWAAGGTPFAVFPLTPEELVSVTGGTVADIARGAGQG